MRETGIISGPRFNADLKSGPRLVPHGHAEVRAYWEGLRPAGAIPARSAIDPRGLSGALDRVFLAERIGPGLVQVRLAGNALNDLAGMDVRGLPLSCLFQAEARPTLARILTRTFDDPIAADLRLVSGRELGRPQIDARLILLPLLDASGDRTLVLGCLCADEEIGRAPRRFAITHAVEERILLEPSPTMSAPIALAHPRDAAGRAHLRLVYSAE